MYMFQHRYLKNRNPIKVSPAKKRYASDICEHTV